MKRPIFTPRPTPTPRAEHRAAESMAAREQRRHAAELAEFNRAAAEQGRQREALRAQWRGTK